MGMPEYAMPWYVGKKFFSRAYLKGTRYEQNHSISSHVKGLTVDVRTLQLLHLEVFLLSSFLFPSSSGILQTVQMF